MPITKHRRLPKRITQWLGTLLGVITSTQVNSLHSSRQTLSPATGHVVAFKLAKFGNDPLIQRVHLRLPGVPWPPQRYVFLEKKLGKEDSRGKYIYITM